MLLVLFLDLFHKHHLFLGKCFFNLFKTIKFIFSGTIRENLIMNHKNLISDEEILSIISEANLGIF